MNTSIIAKTMALLIMLASLAGCSSTGHRSGNLITDITRDLIQLSSGKPGAHKVVKQWTQGTSNSLKKYLHEKKKKQVIAAAMKSFNTPDNNTEKWRRKASSNIKGLRTKSSYIKGSCRNIKHAIFQNGKPYNTISTFCRDSHSGRMLPRNAS